MCSPVWFLWCVVNVLATKSGANGREKTVETVEKGGLFLKMVTTHNNRQILKDRD